MIYATLLFTIPDVGVAIGIEAFKLVQEWLPLGTYNLGWLLPAMLVFILSNLFQTKKQLA